MKSTRLFRVLAIGLGLAAGCSKDSTGPALDASLEADVAVVAGASAAEDAAMMDNPGMGTGSIQLGSEFRLSGCTYNATVGRFECPPESFGGLLFTRSYTFLNAAGQAMLAFDVLLTASTNVRSQLSGTVSRNDWSATIDWGRDFTVSGMAGTETSWTWNGTGTANVQGSHHTSGGTTRNYDITMSTVVNSVVVSYPRSAGSYPSSGSITKTVTVTVVGGANDGQVLSRTATITFDGTQTANLTVGSSHFTVDLATHVVTQIN